MTDTFEFFSRLARQRRSIFPAMYSGEAVPDETIRQLLEIANWAPTHRKTEPWRFHVFGGEARQRVSDYLAGYYKDHTPPEQFSEIKYKKNQRKPLQSSHILFICMQRDPQERVPEWEELAAVSCAVMNLWLGCAALGLGCYWSSPQAALEAGDFLQLAPGERCLGLFYTGVPKPGLELPAERGPVADKVRWHGEE